MSELLDADGPWSLDLIAFMAPVALKGLANRKAAFFRSIVAAVSGMFKGGENTAMNFAQELDGAIKSAEAMQSGAAGVQIETAQEQGADALLKLMEKIPMRKNRKGK